MVETKQMAEFWPMSIMMVSILCRCGHMQHRHQKSETFKYNKFYYCFHCDCMEFKMDNLKYLESKYEENHHD